jgi:hypothetical protein
MPWTARQASDCRRRPALLCDPGVETVDVAERYLTDFEVLHLRQHPSTQHCTVQRRGARPVFPLRVLTEKTINQIGLPSVTAKRQPGPDLRETAFRGLQGGLAADPADFRRAHADHRTAVVGRGPPRRDRKPAEHSARTDVALAILTDAASSIPTNPACTAASLRRSDPGAEGRT